MAGQSNPYTPITFSAVLPLKNGIFTVNMPTPPVGGGWHIYGKNAYDKMGLGIFTRKKITVNMPPFIKLANLCYFTEITLR